MVLPGLSPFGGNIYVFRLGGLPPNQTPIGLGPSRGHPIKISTSGPPPIGLGSLGGCPAYKLPTCRQRDPLSQGQRQLFCLACAILRKSKVVVLDGVSASVDIRTDELTQRIIREEFKDCTIISAAHRLNTIVDFDRIAVLSVGRVVELDEPETLLRREGRGFRKL
jgi:hypothetical protein